jgi:hypothetical protein
MSERAFFMPVVYKYDDLRLPWACISGVTGIPLAVWGHFGGLGFPLVNF